MTTEFIHTVGTSEIYGNFTDWEAECQCDLTAATTKVFSHGGMTGSIVDGNSVTGQTSGATGTVRTDPTSTQILLVSISGTFSSGEKVQVNPSKHVTISDAGDDAIAVIELKAQTFSEHCRIDGWTCSATNHPIIRAASGAEYDHVDDSGARIDRGADFTLDLQTSGYTIVQDIGVGSSSYAAGYMRGDNAAQRFDRCTFYSDIEVFNAANYSGRNYYACLIVVATYASTSILRYSDLYNCTVICDNSSGATFRDGDYDNCICMNANTTPTNPNFFNGTGDYNAESVSDNDTTIFTNFVLDVATSDFNAHGTGDYTLSGTGSALYHAGSTLADPTEDHDGVSYHATTASIGAFEYVAAGGIIPQIMHHRRSLTG